MVKLSEAKVRVIRKLRHEGKSHRDIAKIYGRAKSVIYYHTKDIKLSAKQHHFLLARAIIKLRKTLPPETLKEASRKGGLNNPHKFKIKYTRQQLIDRIRSFRNKFGRIPTKREFYRQWHPYLRVFGSWNNAITSAGFEPNPVIFAKKWLADDGHRCDSLSEMIIDNLLSKLEISHQRNVAYPNQKKFTVDFLINNKYWVEFFGLRGELKTYDSLIRKKMKMSKKSGIKIIKLFPEELFPVNRLKKRLEELNKI